MKWLLLALMIVATVLSDMLQSHEMKRAGEQSVGARGMARMLKLIGRRSYLMLAMLFMAISFFSFMALVQAEPLSFAVPASAAGFIFESLLAKFALKEHVGRRRAAGVLLVLGGVLLLGQ